jgi:lincosamide nucleotidyltransferase A/C/D/E
MVSPEEALHIYKLLAHNGIPIWLSGGWGIDALLGEHTRPHKDLDVIMLLDDMIRVEEILKAEGYISKILWEENRWDFDSQGERTATAFYLQAPDGREFDTHALRIDQHGNGIPAWQAPEDFIFSKADLAGVGTINAFPVQCISAASQMKCHAGYELPQKHLRDLERLHERFDLPLPEPFEGSSPAAKLA